MSWVGGAYYWLGRAAVLASRVLQPVNFIMLVFLTSQNDPWMWLSIPGIAIGLGVWLWFDKTHVVDDEMRAWFSRVPQLEEMRDDIKEIKSMLKERG
jgi:hypothetical protein